MVTLSLTGPREDLGEPPKAWWRDCRTLGAREQPVHVQRSGPKPQRLATLLPRVAPDLHESIGGTKRKRCRSALERF